MARLPWSPSSTRTTSIAATAGVAVIFPPPHPIQNGGDGTAMAGTYATANRAIGDNTLTLSTAFAFNAAEAWATLRVTANRLRGSAFQHDSRRYEITAHDGAAGLTFTPVLATAIVAEQSPLGIQADLPSRLSYLMIKTNGVNVNWFYGVGPPSAAAVMALLENGLSEVIVDETSNVAGVAAKPLHLVGAVGAGTVQTRIFMS